MEVRIRRWIRRWIRVHIRLIVRLRIVRITILGLVVVDVEYIVLAVESPSRSWSVLFYISRWAR